MKALIRDRFGPPDVLEVRDVKEPTLTLDKVLVRVRACSLNDWDYTNEDFTRNGRQYDLIVDTKTTRQPADHIRALNPGGTYATSAVRRSRSCSSSRSSAGGTG